MAIVKKLASEEYVREQISQIDLSGSLSVDSTLSIQGAAADAKAVGDKIGDISLLETENKEDLVSAINEASKSGGVSDEQISNRIDHYLENTAITGLTSLEQKCILALFKSAVYTKDMSVRVAELEALWSVRYIMTYNITGVILSNDVAAVKENSPYQTTLTADVGYTLTGMTVSITMGGVDITSSAYVNGAIMIESVTDDVIITITAAELPSYKITNILTDVTNNNSSKRVLVNDPYIARLTCPVGYEMRVLITMGGVDVTNDVYTDNGNINISSVTGDVVITASANVIGLYPAYELASPTTFDGTKTIDTGYQLFDTDKDFTILLDFTPANPSTVKGCVLHEWVEGEPSTTANLFVVEGYSSYYWSVALLKGRANCLAAGTANIKYAITRAANDRFASVSYVKNGEKMVTTTNTNINTSNLIGKTSTMKLGGSAEFLPNTNLFSGTINTCCVYERIMTESEINEFLGV